MSEVGHTRQIRRPDLGKALEAGRDRIEQGAENRRVRSLEGRPNLFFRLPVLAADRLANGENRALGEVGPLDDLLDAIEDDRTGAGEHKLVGVGVELAHAEPGPGGETA